MLEAQNDLPVLTVPMNRADPFFERDATGWQFVNLHSGKSELNYKLYNNTDRVRGVQPAVRASRGFRWTKSEANRIPPQTHY